MTFDEFSLHVFHSSVLPFFGFYVSYITFLGTMSTVAEVDEILSEGESNEVLEMALKEANNLFSVTWVSLADVCTAVERASLREELQKSLAQFNLIMHIFLELRTGDGDSPSSTGWVLFLRACVFRKFSLISIACWRRFRLIKNPWSRSWHLVSEQ